MTTGSFNFDVRSPEFRADPYSFYALLRNFAPVIYSEDWNAWIVSSYDGCRTLLRDLRLGHHNSPESSFIFMNPPEHTRLRRLVSKAFTKSFIESRRGRVQAIMDELVDDVEPRGRMDLMSEIAYPFPLLVIADFFGLPVENLDDIKRWARATELMMDPLKDESAVEEAQTGRNEFAAFLQDQLKDRAANPRDDLLTGLMKAEADGDRLSPADVISSAIIMIVAGHATSVNMIGNGMLTLLRHPDQLEMLKKDPDLAGRAVEELLRWEPPGQIGHRFALEDVTYRDWTFKKDDLILLIVAAANRDPAEFENPETLDITRKKNNHLSFGAGIHACIGAPLGHMEGHIAFNTLLRRLPNVKLASESVDYHENFAFRALKSLELTY